eukprot:c25044_g1_i1 orf=52-1569(+)
MQSYKPRERKEWPPTYRRNESASAMASPKQHAVVLCFPQQGHVNPLMHLSKRLAAHGFIITFVLSQHDYDRMMRSIVGSNDEQELQTLDIRLVGVPDGLPIQYPESDDLYGKLFRESYDAMMSMRQGVEQLMHKLHASDQPATLMLSDMFMTWAHEVASKFETRLVGFFTSNAISCSIFNHARYLYSQSILPFRDESGNFIARDDVTCIPGVSPLHPSNFPVCLTFPASHYRFQFILNQYDNFRNVSAIVINTFEDLELESDAITALKKSVNIYPIGPLLLLCGEKVNRTPVPMSYLREEDECLKWLDRQPVSSVLYVSFGSAASLPLAQIKELALGIEASRQRFLWVIRSDSVEGSVTEVLPEGFALRTKDQGIIISWAPQVLVLSHVSVGAFLSHCGWNSMMENISTGGLPMLCWPQVAEQRLNCRILVDHWKIAMEFKKEEDGLVSKEEAARVVRAVMDEEEGKHMKIRAAEIRQKAIAATQEGGSSQKELESFVQFLTTQK